VYLSVCPYDISKTDTARITKRDIEMFHHESLVWSQRSRSWGTKKQCQRGLLLSYECWLCLVQSSFYCLFVSLKVMLPTLTAFSVRVGLHNLVKCPTILWQCLTECVAVDRDIAWLRVIGWVCRWRCAEFAAWKNVQSPWVSCCCVVTEIRDWLLCYWPSYT